MTVCPFCEISEGREPAEFVHEWSDAIAIVPLNPVVKGHTLVIPKTHVADFASDPAVSASTMRRAAQLMEQMDRPMNLITSRGREATQSVFHLHLHLVPRAENDGLALPWYSGHSKRSGCGPECSEMHTETGRCEIAQNRSRPGGTRLG
ncbi:HIT family protein [Streptomyces griseus]|uniref:HIT family protein n=1 Tax=Streptomyces griseus TaxID=1911 RepID=UPI0037AD1CD3